MNSGTILGRGLIVVLAAALAGAAAWFISDREEEQYSATTRLLFGPPTPELRAIGVGSESDEEQRSLQNRVMEVRSFDVARATAKAMGRKWTADEVASKIEVSAERDADIVNLGARTPSPAQSARLVTEYRRQFIERQQQLVRRRAEEAQKALLLALAELPPGAKLGPRGETLRAQLGVLRVLERTGGQPVIVEGVRAYANPVSPQKERNTIFGLLFGGVLGVGLVSLAGATRVPSKSPRSR